MVEKRMKKLESLREALPEPEIHGITKGAAVSFVGWGSSKNAMLDCIAQNPRVNYLHFDYLYPLKTETLLQFFKDNKNVHLIEGNYQGQLGQLIACETGAKFKGRLLKYNGRPFFMEDVMEYINSNL